jgi:hypothetical protein
VLSESPSKVNELDQLQGKTAPEEAEENIKPDENNQ